MGKTGGACKGQAGAGGEAVLLPDMPSPVEMGVGGLCELGRCLLCSDEVTYSLKYFIQNMASVGGESGVSMNHYRRGGSIFVVLPSLYGYSHSTDNG